MRNHIYMIQNFQNSSSIDENFEFIDKKRLYPLICFVALVQSREFRDVALEQIPQGYLVHYVPLRVKEHS